MNRHCVLCTSPIDCGSWDQCERNTNMVHLGEHEWQAIEKMFRADETERCALLCDTLAAIHCDAAKRIRKSGEYTVRALWPFGKKVTFVRPGYEREAQKRDDVVYALEAMAKCMRAGYDPRKHIENPNEQIKFEPSDKPKWDCSGLADV